MSEPGATPTPDEPAVDATKATNGAWWWAQRILGPTAGLGTLLVVAAIAIRLAGWEAPLPVISLGVLLGILYGALAVGLILIFRTSQVINLAIGAFGIFAASLYQMLAISLRLPFLVAFPLALGIAAGLGAATDMVIVRRFAHAPRILVMVLTLGVAAVLTTLTQPIQDIGYAVAERSGFGVSGSQPTGEPPLLPSLNIGALLVPPRQVLLAILTPILLVWLVWALRRTRAGLAVRAVAGNTELVQLTGTRARTVTTAVWALSATVAALATILGPVQVTAGSEADPYPLVLRALVAAVLARMHGLAMAFTIGIGISITEQILLWNNIALTWLDAAILLVLLVDALLTRRILGQAGDTVGGGR